jgi:hypothetical protein
MIAAALILQFGHPPPASSAAPAVTSGQSIAVDQGTAWTPTERAAYYSQDQGSRLMPLSWIFVLKQSSGDGFMADKLARYGYLVNGENPASNLPVGFTLNSAAGQTFVGMTCSACHTRQIEVGSANYRIDGGPAIADFQSFMADLDQAVGRVLGDNTAFANFAAAVLAGQPNTAQVADLRQQVQAWYTPYHAIVSGGLPAKPWGPSRLDAVGMIFDRLTGLDIGPTPDHIIAANIQPADAPVRYPFLWNASRQDQTQWPGFAANGDGLLALARNTGEVFGVFAQFHPTPDMLKPVLKVNYKGDNSANPEGLLVLEDLITRIGPPVWPWTHDETLRQQGEVIFNLPAKQGGCVECHGVTQGKPRLFAPQTTWATPVLDVGTDNREWKMLGVTGRKDFPGWTVDTGVLAGAEVPFLIPALKARDTPFNTLGMAVIGTILQRLPDIGRFMTADHDDPTLTGEERATGVYTHDATAEELEKAFTKKTAPDPTPFKYESRVLQGIWATAPYLHNGSVPTLADLLNTSSQRPKSFQIGPAYDPVKVGLAAQQTKFGYTLTTTGCEDRSSGASNCGHEFGTNLTLAQKAALLEYLKTL